MELDSADNPAEVWQLRREFHSLHRQLRSGQQRLRSSVLSLNAASRDERLTHSLRRQLRSGQQRLGSSVRSLNAASKNERAAQRSERKRHRTKTSTPKVSNQPPPVSAPPDLVTPVSGPSTQRLNGSQRSTDHNKSRSRSRQRSALERNSSLGVRFLALSSPEGVDSSSHDGSPALERPPRRRSKRLSGRGGGKENESRSSGRRTKYMEIMQSSTADESSDASGNGATPLTKSILLTPGARVPGKTPNRVAFVDRLNQLSVKRRRVSQKDRSLLGYDWIAGVLESGSEYAARSDEYFEDLRQFRRTHRDDCVHDTVSKLSATLMDSTLPPKPEDEGSSPPQSTHKCIHNYHLNSRLFPVPLHEASDGESLCAICRDRKKERPSRASPAYIRVSIPRSTLVSPYKARSHRRRSYDPTDSLGLSQHCLAGWQNSKPSMMPTASNIDLKSALGPSTERGNVNPTDEDIPPTRRIPRMSRRTQQLMNRSLALQLDAQRLSKEGPSGTRPARSRMTRKALAGKQR